MKQLAIIGPTASGKSALALELAKKVNALILSIDSLSVYHSIDIASAKPSSFELKQIPHYGINCLSPDEPANVFTFIEEYKRACHDAHLSHKNLLIIGGSSFYLKSMIDGLSELPLISDETRERTQHLLTITEDAHAFLHHIDPTSGSKIAINDRYRLEKLLHIYFETQTPPSEWFLTHPPKPFVPHCPILNLSINRSILRQRIELRTNLMIQEGLIDEAAYLEKTYGRHPNSMKAIGIIETLDYLDGKLTKKEMIEAISTHTAQLAKRQTTFNTNQFSGVTSGDAEALSELALAHFS